jgi:hypothetical protein
VAHNFYPLEPVFQLKMSSFSLLFWRSDLHESEVKSKQITSMTPFRPLPAKTFTLSSHSREYDVTQAIWGYPESKMCLEIDWYNFPDFYRYLLEGLKIQFTFLSFALIYFFIES